MTVIPTIQQAASHHQKGSGGLGATLLLNWSKKRVRILSPPSTSAPALHIVEPTIGHSHTAILLHVRGDNGPDFATEILNSQFSLSSKPSGRDVSDLSSNTLRILLPSWRWVFPSAPLRWSNVFKEDITTWVEMDAPSDVVEREDIRMSHMRNSVASIVRILDEEIATLDGNFRNVVLGGISQGAAEGLWTLLSYTSTARRLGGFVGASCWLPFASIAGNYVSLYTPNSLKAYLEPYQTASSGGSVQSTLEAIIKSRRSTDEEDQLLSTPVLLGRMRALSSLAWDLFLTSDPFKYDHLQ